MNTATTITAAQWQASAALFSSLCDPAQRALSYRALITDGRPLLFASRANACYPPSITGPDHYAQHAWLITRRLDALTALQSSSSAGRPADYSNAAFGALGRHNFMLGMGAEQGQGQGQDHAHQRAFARACLSEKNSGETHALCTISLRAAAVLPLKKGQFDGVQLAEQAALRFVVCWFGFAQSDLPLLQACTRKASHALSYQTFARHFATDPLAIADNSAAMAALSRRAAELIDLFAYQHTAQQRDAFKALARELQELRDFEPDRVFEPWPAPAGYAGSGSPSTHSGPMPARPLSAFEPVMRRMAGLLTSGQSPYGGTDLANLVTGLIAGTVGNVVSSVALALRCLFADDQRLQAAIAAAGQDWLAHGHRAGPDATLTPFIWEALRLDPPVAFLPRRSTRAITLNGVPIAPGSELLIAVGAATRDHPAWDDADCFKPERYARPGQAGTPAHDPLIFGGEPDDPATGRSSSFLHQCIGQHVAMPLLTHIVRQMLLLPGLAEAINPRDGKPLGLSQQWAYHCLSYPLVYHRHALLRHSALLLLMDLQSPSQAHAPALLEQQQKVLLDALQQSGCVHFASVLLLNNNTQLALFAFIDQDINNHLPQLAQALGPVLSPLLAHIRHAPPGPTALAWGHLFDFLSQILTTARKWNDNASVRLPGVRERVVNIYLDPQQYKGGLNLNLRGTDILQLAAKGQAAGQLLVDQFLVRPEPAAVLASEPSQHWHAHRWLRFTTFVNALQVKTAGFQRSATQAVHAQPLAHMRSQIQAQARLTPTQSQALAEAQTALEHLEHLEHSLNPSGAPVQQPAKPRPQAELRLRAPL